MFGPVVQNRIVGEVNRRQVVAKDYWRSRARLSKLEEEVFGPLYLGEGCCKGSLLSLGAAPAHGGLFRRLPRDQVRAVEDAVAGGGPPVVKHTGAPQLWNDTELGFQGGFQY
ncbi:hypothetical protein PIB30_074308 [Stylosanthes scabra]|uniref:Uncharacterized protein n=1 Tax=Stylosanthes scabra TaxID=79078 RepID=A0ABU6ZNG1_9FABA|nr:hypothetical protein [Stylosanthes scabra]